MCVCACKCAHVCAYILFHNKNKELRKDYYGGPGDGDLI